MNIVVQPLCFSTYPVNSLCITIFFVHKYFGKLGQVAVAELYSFGQVAAVVFTEDLKKLYVTMKEGFPLEFVVSHFKIVTGDQKSQISLQGSPAGVPSWTCD